jgi:diaminohydroxyphosphoribosylaminopyrimidine deaminase / 5-amino-6-(5-phosphoribosylamino)uracil reductase
VRAVLHDLARRGCASVLIEGGGELLGSAFDARLVDRVVFYLAPVLCGGPDVIAGRGAGTTDESLRLENMTATRLGPDVRIAGDVARR